MPDILNIKPQKGSGKDNSKQQIISSFLFQYCFALTHFNKSKPGSQHGLQRVHAEARAGYPLSLWGNVKQLVPLVSSKFLELRLTFLFCFFFLYIGIKYNNKSYLSLHHKIFINMVNSLVTKRWQLLIFLQDCGRK